MKLNRKVHVKMALQSDHLFSLTFRINLLGMIIEY